MLLELSEIYKAYRSSGREVAALAGVSLALAPGEMVAVQGPSGAGKSTLLLIAGGLLAPDTGEVRLESQNVYSLSAEQRALLRAAKLGFVFQQFHLVPYLSALDNVLAPALAGRLEGDRERALELLDHYGLAERARHVPSQLSVGERQRVALARALLHRPKLILADEPTANLDAASAQTVARGLCDFVSQGGSVLLVSHDAQAVAFAHRVLRLNNGRLEREAVAV